MSSNVLPAANPCFTLGYSGLELAEVRAFLDATASFLVDIRFNPASSTPEWNRASLRRVLGDRYRWVRDLGNVAYKTGGIRLADPGRGVEIVSTLLRVQPVVLLCVCGGRVECCHRWRAANLIREATGCELRHLRRDDIQAAHQLDLLTPNH